MTAKRPRRGRRGEGADAVSFWAGRPRTISLIASDLQRSDLAPGRAEALNVVASAARSPEIGDDVRQHFLEWLTRYSAEAMAIRYSPQIAAGFVYALADELATRP